MSGQAARGEATGAGAAGTRAGGPMLTNLDRVLWPAAGFTKGDMLAYYEAVAPVLLPHLAGRPLTLGRFPHGIDGPGFATTECRGRPVWMRHGRRSVAFG